MSYIQYTKPVDAKEAIAKIELRIKQNIELDKLYKTIIPVLESWNGKKPGKPGLPEMPALMMA
jgi:hypothetical protein